MLSINQHLGGEDGNEDDVDDRIKAKRMEDIIALFQALDAGAGPEGVVSL